MNKQQKATHVSTQGNLAWRLEVQQAQVTPLLYTTRLISNSCYTTYGSPPMITLCLIPFFSFLWHEPFQERRVITSPSLIWINCLELFYKTEMWIKSSLCSSLPVYFTYKNEIEIATRSLPQIRVAPMPGILWWQSGMFVSRFKSSFAHLSIVCLASQLENHMVNFSSSQISHRDCQVIRGLRNESKV